MCKRWGGTVAGEENARRRRAGGQDWIRRELLFKYINSLRKITQFFRFVCARDGAPPRLRPSSAISRTTPPFLPRPRPRSLPVPSYPVLASCPPPSGVLFTRYCAAPSLEVFRELLFKYIKSLRKISQFFRFVCARDGAPHPESFEFSRNPIRTKCSTS